MNKNGIVSLIYTAWEKKKCSEFVTFFNILF